MSRALPFCFVIIVLGALMFLLLNPENLKATSSSFGEAARAIDVSAPQARAVPIQMEPPKPGNPQGCALFLADISRGLLSGMDILDAIASTGSAAQCAGVDSDGGNFLREAGNVTRITGNFYSDRADPATRARPDAPSLEAIRKGGSIVDGSFFGDDVTFHVVNERTGEFFEGFIIDGTGATKGMVQVMNVEGTLVLFTNNLNMAAYPGMGRKLIQAGDNRVMWWSTQTGENYFRVGIVATEDSLTSFSKHPGGLKGFWEAFGFQLMGTPEQPVYGKYAGKFISSRGFVPFEEWSPEMIAKFNRVAAELIR